MPFSFFPPNFLFPDFIALWVSPAGEPPAGTVFLPPRGGTPAASGWPYVLLFAGGRNYPHGHLTAEYFSEVLAVSRRRGLCLALCQTAVSVRETPFVYDFQRHFRPRFVTSFLPLNMRKPCKFPKLTRLSAYSVLLPTLSARYNISARACACVRFYATSFCAARRFSHGFPVACDFCPPGSKIWHAFLTWFFPSIVTFSFLHRAIRSAACRKVTSLFSSAPRVYLICSPRIGEDIR